MLTIRGDIIDRINADAYKTFFEAYDQLDTYYDKLFEVVNSTGSYMQDNILTGLSDPVEKPEGDPITFDRAGGGRVIIGKNISWTAGAEFSKESVDDFSVEGITNLLQAYVKTWAPAFVRKREKFAADFFNKGGLTAGDKTFNNSIPGKVIDASGDLVYDGKPFFNLTGNARSSLKGGTYYNGHALPLSDTNLKTVYTHMTSTSAYDEKDEKIAIRPTAILVPPGLKFTTENILQATNVLNSANNDVNTVRGLVEPIVNPYLTDADAWFLGVPKQGLKWSNRQQVVLRFFQNPITLNYCATADARWGAWVNDWRYWQGSQFSTS